MLDCIPFSLQSDEKYIDLLQKFKFSKNINNIKCAPEMIFFNEKKENNSDNFRKSTLKVRKLQTAVDQK